MRRHAVNVALSIPLAIWLLAAPGVYAQATVETGGATAGAATNVTTLVPDFTGMATTITNSATAPQVEAAPRHDDASQLETPPASESQADPPPAEDDESGASE
jgi:hypothetical protein